MWRVKPSAADLDTFAEHHRCASPQADGEVNQWGGLKCVTCGWEVIVYPHLAPAYYEPAD